MKNAWIALVGFLAAATFLLWEEHQAHILGALPWVLLLLCPILHLFMHRGHNGHGSHDGHGGAGGHAGDHGNTGQKRRG
ncbi:MAG TPA: DUF2933 domain-containing protein [Candidatus Limnocylindria bacterium]|nr:DUF2933 domain-containing protein [Candidatus Limnocylindria bacterium]